MRLMGRILPFLLSLIITITSGPTLTSAATPPLLPFNQTGDLYVLDDGCDCVLRVDQSGTVSIAVTNAQIVAITGALVSFDEAGIAFDANDVMYFTESGSDSILRFPPGGPLSEVVDEAAIGAVTGAGPMASLRGLAFGADGNLYTNERDANVVIRVVPGTGAVTVLATAAALDTAAATDINVNTGIVGSENGTIYTLSDDSDNLVFAVTAVGMVSVISNGSPPYNDLDVFMTRSSNGDLIIADDLGADTIFRLTPGGAPSVFLTQAQIRAASSNSGSDLEGGIAFDAAGAFYIAERAEDEILRFANPPTGGVFVSASAIQSVTGVPPVLEGGIAFSRLTHSPAISAPAAGTSGILFLMLGLGLLGVARLQGLRVHG